MSVHDTDTARAVRTIGRTSRMAGDSVYAVDDEEEEEREGGAREVDDDDDDGLSTLELI